MNQRWAKILQIVSLAMLAWFSYSLLGRLHWLLVFVLFVFTVANVGTVWMLREQRGILRVACRIGLLRRYVGFVCYWTGDQLPVHQSATKPGAELLLRSHRDFAIAADRAKQIVRGHNHVIDGVWARIHENQTLRRSRRDGDWRGPLAAFLLVGGPGVGKRYLTRVLAKLLYRDGDIDVFECDTITPGTLVGVKDSPGELLEMVRKQPHRVVLFEHVDRASPDVIKLLVRLLTTGKLRWPGSDKDVSFQNTVIALTTTKGADLLAALTDQKVGPAAWQQRAIAALAEETQMDESLLHAVTDLFFCGTPDDLVKCEVVALLMKKECGAHRTELSFVEPEIIATQVLQIDDGMGFAHAPQLVKRLLRSPLVAATAGSHQALSLRVRAGESRAATRTS